MNTRKASFFSNISTKNLVFLTIYENTHSIRQIAKVHYSSFNLKHNILLLSQLIGEKKANSCVFFQCYFSNSSDGAFIKAVSGIPLILIPNF